MSKNPPKADHDAPHHKAAPPTASNATDGHIKGGGVPGQPDALTGIEAGQRPNPGSQEFDATHGEHAQDAPVEEQQRQAVPPAADAARHHKPSPPHGASKPVKPAP